MSFIYHSEIHHIHKKDSRWEEIDNICFLSKNLYNCALYEIRQFYFNNNTFKTHGGYITNKTDLYHILKNSVDFRNGLATRPNKSVFIQVEKIFKSYFNAIKEYDKNKSKFNGKPKLPKYKDKISGRNIITYTKEALSFKKKGYIRLSMTDIYVKTNKQKDEVVEIRLVPTNLNFYQLEIIYKKEIKELNLENKKYIGIDLGVNNLLSLSSNDSKLGSIVINGRPIKQLNSSYNKLIAKYKTLLPNEIYTSKRIKHITYRRNNKIKDYFHKTAKMLVKYFIDNGISTVVIGKNNGWKQEVNLGKRNNQNFTYIPFNKIIFYLKYRCELEGIEFIEREESYTSKCSFLDMEPIKKHNTYLGKRIKRGLFESSNKIQINADINAALNILRKEIGNSEFINSLNSICDFAVSPVKMTTPVSGKLLITK